MYFFKHSMFFLYQKQWWRISQSNEDLCLVWVTGKPRNSLSQNSVEHKNWSRHFRLWEEGDLWHEDAIRNSFLSGAGVERLTYGSHHCLARNGRASLNSLQASSLLLELHQNNGRNPCLLEITSFHKQSLAEEHSKNEERISREYHPKAAQTL
ncbi:UNVERIFIED_CONTAM: hypothetical protein K2H54_002972 [Gekko kuhli]